MGRVKGTGTLIKPVGTYSESEKQGPLLLLETTFPGTERIIEEEYAEGPRQGWLALDQESTIYVLRSNMKLKLAKSICVCKINCGTSIAQCPLACDDKNRCSDPTDPNSFPKQAR